MSRPATARQIRAGDWIERDGQRLPARRGGHQALDFCNTRDGWDPPTSQGEWLRDYDRFVAWAGYVEVLDPDEERDLRGRSGARADGVLTQARELRSAVRTAVLQPSDLDAMELVTGYVRRASAGLRLVPGPEPRWRVDTPDEMELPLHRIAWAAGDLLTSGRLDRVKACPGPNCGWVFLDTSGRRRWCSMASCGNRAKVRAYSERSAVRNP